MKNKFVVVAFTIKVMVAMIATGTIAYIKKNIGKKKLFNEVYVKLMIQLTYRMSEYIRNMFSFCRYVRLILKSFIHHPISRHFGKLQ